MNAPRIAFVTTFYPPFNFGGDGIGIQRLARAFARRGWDVTVVRDEDAYLNLAKAEPSPAPADPGVEVIGLRSSFGLVSNLLTHQFGRPVVHHDRLKQILAPGAFDVISFNNISLVGGPGVLAYGDGIKIYEAHEHWLVCPTHVLWRYNRELCDAKQCLSCTLSYRRPPQLWRYTDLLGRNLRHVDTFIAKSEFSREKHREFGFPGQMEVIPYFLPDDATGDGAQDSAPPYDRPYFLFVGRLEKIKGLQDILPAFDGPAGADLLIAGAGDYEPELRRLAGDNPRIRFLGRLAPEALARYYRHAIALAAPSVCYETFGIILIEAFRNGTPVIARELGPFPEIVRKSGAGVLYRDQAEFAQALASLEADGAMRAALARNARESFKTYWSEDAVMADYYRLLHGLALAKGAGNLLAVLESGT
jgi:glycosyltransferase involved in cell wall biosynthesis